MFKFNNQTNLGDSILFQYFSILDRTRTRSRTKTRKKISCFCLG